jgi:proteasome lid subunit RPN8/RPN11
MIIFTDRCLAQIGEGIAAHEPEVGGALLKLHDSNIVCEFVPDPGARTSASTYVPSAELSEKVRGAEREQRLQFAGIVHSHPGTMMHPSGQDHRAFALSLALNPRLGAFIAPIVTVRGTVGELRPNQHLLEPRGLMTLHAAYRTQRGLGSTQHLDRSSQGFIARPTAVNAYGRHDPTAAWQGRSDDPRNDGVELFEPPVGVLSIDADIAYLKEQLVGKGGPEWLACNISYVDVNGSPFISAALRFVDFELVLLMPTGYPFAAPIVLLTPLRGEVQGDTEQLRFDWPIAGQDVRLKRLVEAVRAKCGAPDTNVGSPAAGSPASRAPVGDAAVIVVKPAGGPSDTLDRP